MQENHRFRHAHDDSKSEVTSSDPHSDSGSALEETETKCQNVGASEVERGIPGGAHHVQQPFHFLDLPSDIRQMIYRFVFGDRNIRVRCYEDYSQGDDNEFAEDLCVTEILSFRLQKHDIATDLEELFWFELNTDGEDRANNHFYGGDAVCLNLLLANKQVYREACKIPCSTNIFSFFEARVFQLFISPWFSGRPRGSRKKLVRNIALYVPLFAEPSEDEWDSPPSSSSAWKPRGLNELQQLHIVIGRREREGGMDTVPETSDEEWEDIYHLNDLFVFAKLNLQKVTVEVLLNWHCGKSDQEQVNAFARRLW